MPAPHSLGCERQLCKRIGLDWIVDPSISSSAGVHYLEQKKLHLRWMSTVVLWVDWDIGYGWVFIWAQADTSGHLGRRERTEWERVDAATSFSLSLGYECHLRPSAGLCTFGNKLIQIWGKVQFLHKKIKKSVFVQHFFITTQICFNGQFLTTLKVWVKKAH